MSIAERAVRGAALAVATGVGGRALGLVGTLLIARYLVPAEYGEVSAAYIVVATANQFSTLGVGMYVFANPKAGRDVLFHATVGHILVGAIALGLMFLFRNALGLAIGMPFLHTFVPGLILAALLDRVTYIPERILLRDLRFAQVSVLRTVGEVSYTAVSLGMAMTGWGAMSMVYGNITRSLLRLIGIGIAAERRAWLEPCRIRARTLGTLIGYGSAVSFAGFAIFAARRWDNLLIARMFGPATMGTYNLAYNLADVPSVQVGEQLTDILLPSFSQVDPAKRSDVLLRSCTLLALIMFPLAGGLGAVAPSIGRAFFSPEWAEVAPMLMILSLLAAARPVAGALMAYLHSMNLPRTVMWLEWFSLAILLSGIATLGLMGPRWACAAVSLAFCVRALAAMMVLGRIEGIRLQSFLGALIRPLLACMPMVAAVLAVHNVSGVYGWGPPSLVLAVETTVGAVVYVGSALLIARHASFDMIRLCRSALVGSSEATPLQTGGVR